MGFPLFVSCQSILARAQFSSSFTTSHNEFRPSFLPPFRPSFRPVSLPSTSVLFRSSFVASLLRTKVSPRRVKKVPQIRMTSALQEENFDFVRWANHRGSSRYMRYMRTLRHSVVVRAVSYPVAVVLLFTIIICILNHWLLPMYKLPILAMPLLPLQLTSFALSLMLVFRTNSAHTRYRDARAALGVFGNACKNIARQSQQWVSPASPRVHQEIINTTAVTLRALAADFTGKQGDNLGLTDGLPLLPFNDKIFTLSTPLVGERTLRATQLLTQAVMRAPGLSQRRGLAIDKQIAILVDTVGACQRIITTPIPLSYTRHTSRFLLIWLLLLPCGLYPVLQLNVIIAMPLIAFSLLAIDEIGVEIEEPFFVLPVDNLCNGLERQLPMTGLPAPYH